MSVDNDGDEDNENKIPEKIEANKDSVILISSDGDDDNEGLIAEGVDENEDGELLVHSDLDEDNEETIAEEEEMEQELDPAEELNLLAAVRNKLVNSIELI